MEISGYLNLQLRCEGHRCNIYQAQRQIDGLPVILKVLRETYPRPQEVARFRREYKITQRFDAPNIIRCYDLIQSGNQFAIALEDFGGRALNEHLSKDQPLLPLAQALSLMTRIAEAIG